MQRSTNSPSERPSEGRRLAELRRSNASGFHGKSRNRAAERREIQAINLAEDEYSYGLREWLNP